MDFNDVGREGGGWGQKVLSRPSADIAVGRRQKARSIQNLEIRQKNYTCFDKIMLKKNI
jgi:hypothetical protein